MPDGLDGSKTWFQTKDFCSELKTYVIGKDGSWNGPVEDEFSNPLITFDFYGGSDKKGMRYYRATISDGEVTKIERIRGEYDSGIGLPKAQVS